MAATAKPRVVLLDIEGTVCPISFVKDVLFPYALSALPATLTTSWDDPAFAPYRDAFPAEHATSPAALTAHVQDLMSRDVKVGYLKSLQGYLWESGYRAGALRAPLFPDVAPRLAAWRERDGVRVMIYSSGSVAAQRLLFRHTDAAAPAGGAAAGDLTPLIDDYFDTVNAGPKTEPASYEAILARHRYLAPAGEWLFLSDNVREVEAAKKAGMQSFVVERPGNAALSEEDRARHRVIRSFDEL
ncbi:hypothetical protein VTK26DRAFT_5005 [Humicola hyalothermophila]